MYEQPFSSFTANKKKRYYTPQFSEMAAVTVRRFAWAVGLPMTSAVDLIIKALPSIMQASKVCHVCRDKTKCSLCIFNPQLRRQEESVRSGVSLCQ
jgi:recombinational DNA repair protein RecR